MSLAEQTTNECILLLNLNLKFLTAWFYSTISSSLALNRNKNDCYWIDLGMKLQYFSKIYGFNTRKHAFKF